MGLKRKLYYLSILVLSVVSQIHSIPTNDAVSDSYTDESYEDFSHLLNLVGTQKRIHILSELTRNGYQLTVNEYLDLNTWTQLIEFKWRYILGDGSVGTKRHHALIINNGELKHIIQYKQYQCQMKTHNSSDQSSKSENWRVEIAATRSIDHNQSGQVENQQFEWTIQSLISTAENSPYLSRVSVPNAQDAYVFGITGAWIRAQESGSSSLSQVNHLVDRKLARDSQYWQMLLGNANIDVSYYFESSLFDNSQSKLLSLLELKDSKTKASIDLVNVISVEFSYSDQLARDLVALPIGFGCPSHPTITKDSRIVFEQRSSNMLMDIEIVATKFKGLEDSSLQSLTEVKRVSLATTNHSLDPRSKLIMVENEDDQNKVIQDFYNRLKYSHHVSGNIKYCEIERLHITDKETSQASDPIGIYFDSGISLALDDESIDYLINAKGDEQSSWKPLNKISKSESYEELIYEAEVPDSKRHLINIFNKRYSYAAAELTLIRVYQQEVFTSDGEFGKPKRRTGLAKLSRVILMAFDTDRKSKVAEIRLNILRDIHPLSYQRRSQIFDLSLCYNLDRDSMELSALFPMDPDLLEFIMNKRYEAVEKFYSSASDWLTSAVKEPSSLKHRLGASMNFLRIPKVELSATDDGDMELNILVLDRVSLMYLFDRVYGSVLSEEATSEIFMVQFMNDCANWCNQFNCTIFSIDSSLFECRLGFDLYDKKLISTKSLKSLVTKRSTSITYHRPSYSDVVYPLEASLSELHEYLDHNLGELNIDDELDLDARQKREVTVEDRPFMSFSFTTTSDLKNKYSPPKERLVVPSKVTVPRVLMSFDVGAEYQELRMAAAFRTRIDGKRYRLDALDYDNNIELAIKMDERVFEHKSEKAYYVAKQVRSVNLKVCETLCYNIDEWDSDTSSEQVCESFSYCNFEHDCILLTKTDKDFTKSILDVASEGDIVLTIEGLDQLTSEGYGCMIAKRNHISYFEGPIKVVGYPRYSSEFEAKINYEWLKVLSIEADEPNGFDLESCSNECSKRKSSYCLGFDYCHRELETDTKGKFRYETSCYIVTIDRADIKQPESSKRLAHLKDQLKTHRNGEVAKISSDLRTHRSEETCNRFLQSTLRRFKPVRGRQLTTEILNKFWTVRVRADNLNLDGCAIECSARDTNCLAFQYCSSIDDRTKQLVRNCTMLTGLRAGTSLGKGQESEYKHVTQHVANCHIYVKEEYSSLDGLMKNAKVSPVTVMEHSRLILSFSIVFGVAVLIAIWYIVYQRRKNLAR